MVNYRPTSLISEVEFKENIECFQYNKLTINYEKTKYLTFTSYSHNLPLLGPLTNTNKISIPESDRVKYHAVIRDRNVEWDLRKQTVDNNKLRAQVYNFTYIKTNLLMTLYQALAQQHLMYDSLG